jgi:hypothetical protein
MPILIFHLFGSESEPKRLSMLNGQDAPHSIPLRRVAPRREDACDSALLIRPSPPVKGFLVADGFRADESRALANELSANQEQFLANGLLANELKKTAEMFFFNSFASNSFAKTHFLV